jgi:hypothetical protein
MGQEDIVQEECIGYYDYAIAAGVLTVNQSRGFGVITRTGVGTLSITFPAGKGCPNNRLSVEFTSKEGAGTFAVAVLDTTSTDTVKKIVVQDAAGAAVDNIDGAIKLYRVLP